MSSSPKNNSLRSVRSSRSPPSAHNSSVQKLATFCARMYRLAISGPAISASNIRYPAQCEYRICQLSPSTSTRLALLPIINSPSRAPSGRRHSVVGSIYPAADNFAFRSLELWITTFRAIGLTRRTQQAADLLGVSRPTVARVITTGALPAERIGNRHRLLLDDIHAHRAERLAGSIRIRWSALD